MGVGSIPKFKYIKREWKKGKWQYTYPDDEKSQNSKPSLIEKAKDRLGFDEKEKYQNAKANMDAASKAMSNIKNDKTPYAHKQEAYDASIKKWQQSAKEFVTAKKDYQETPIGKIDSLRKDVDNGIKSVKKFFSEPWITHKTTYTFDTDTKDLESKKNSRSKATLEANTKATNKGNTDPQEKERTEVREPELKKQLEELMKNNPLPTLPLKTKATTLDEDMATINESFDWNNPNTSMNCALCTTAYDLRRRGYDVEAMEQVSDLDILGINDLYEGDKVGRLHSLGDIVENATGDPQSRKGSITIDTAVQYLDKELSDYGEGARGNLIFYWTQGSAHSVVWEVENGEVMIRDCQLNKKWKISEYNHWGYVKNMYYIRTDNLTPSEKVLKYVKKDDD